MGTNSNISYHDYVKGITTLSADEQINLIKVLSSVIQKTSRKKESQKNIMELEGLGAEIWQGMDAQEYVRRERVMGLVTALMFF